MYRVTSYPSAMDFLAVAEQALSYNELENNLILGVPLRIRDGGSADSPENLYFAVTAQEQAGERFVGAAAMTPPHNFIVHVERSAEGEALPILRALADAVLPHRDAIPGVIGRTPWVEEFAGIWSEKTGLPVTQVMSERVFALREVLWPRKSEGRLRCCNGDDLPLAIAWFRSFADEALGNEPMSDPEESMRLAVEQQRMYLWEIPQGDGWRAVCMVGKSRALGRGRTVGPVYTPPADRGKGYASNATAAVSATLLDEGWEYATLFTDLSNPTSNSIYQKIGYKPVCDYAVWRIEK